MISLPKDDKFEMWIFKDSMKEVMETDTFYLENYEHLELDESYDNIRERKALEKYAVENKITYNILLNSQNKSAIIPLHARNLLMKFFNKFDIIICFIIIYLSCIKCVGRIP